MIAGPLFAALLTVAASSPDPLAVAAAAKAKGTAARALWGKPITAPFVFVRGDEGFSTEAPKLEGWKREPNGVWSGPMPKGLAAANTAVELAGKRYAMVVMPLPDDAEAGTRLLIHEAFHVVQPALFRIPDPPLDADLGLLDAVEGRTWLRLEIAALCTALEAADPARASAAARDALLFRARRYLKTNAGERDRERLLDLSEGLAEYTAMAATGMKPPAVAEAVRAKLATADSLVRAFPYLTGPATGFLLDRFSPQWRGEIRRVLDLQTLLARGLKAGDLEAWLQGKNGDALKAAADAALSRYDGARIRSEEEARTAQQLAKLNYFLRRFVDEPVLRIRPRALRLAFDPNRNYVLPDFGTVMGDAHWKSDDGAELTAPDGALVPQNWSEVRVPLRGVELKEGTLTEPLSLKGDGWTLSLPAGWTLKKEEKDWVAQRP